jgi:heme A synthase
MWKRRRRPKSIQFWLTWLVIVCILPAAVGAAVLMLRSYEQVRRLRFSGQSDKLRADRSKEA